MKPQQEGSLVEATSNEKGRRKLDSEPIEIIRTETVLSRLPVHQLAKRGSVSIRITRDRTDDAGELLWEPIPNPAIGEPRALAYKVDTLIVNQVLDELGSDFPRVVRLPSLSESARRLRMGGDNQAVKKALEQNAAVSIRAKLSYKDADGVEHEFETFGTRYNVHFWNSKLPDGTRADSVYISFNEPWYGLLTRAPRRPLDYDYLASLSPAPQRWYELASFQFFAALKRNQYVARLRYSEYCLFAAQKRYQDAAKVQKQMYKVHLPHKKSGYIESVKYERTADEDGNPDWIMLYRPGPRAWNEYTTFNPKARKMRAGASPQGSGKPAPVVEFKPKEAAAQADEPDKVDQELLGALTDRGVTEPNARKLLTDLNGPKLDHLADCIRYWDSQKNLGAGALFKLITGDLKFPGTFESTAQRREREQQEAEERRQQDLQIAADLAFDEYWQHEVDQLQEQLPDGRFDELVDEERRAIEADPKVDMTNSWATQFAASQSVRKARATLAKSARLMCKKEFVDRFTADENFRAQHRPDDEQR